jgi:hypothetical protein
MLAEQTDPEKRREALEKNLKNKKTTGMKPRDMNRNWIKM